MGVVYRLSTLPTSSTLDPVGQPALFSHASHHNKSIQQNSYTASHSYCAHSEVKWRRASINTYPARGRLSTSSGGLTQP